MNADITLVNLNMLFIRSGEQTEREIHLPLGCLYLPRALEDAGFRVDFRDYQLTDAPDPFDMNALLDFLRDPAPVIGLSCMANLLPFTILAMKALRERYPDRTLVLGGVGSASVEHAILERFPFIDIICRGEAEHTAPPRRSGGPRGAARADGPGRAWPPHGARPPAPAPTSPTSPEALRTPPAPTTTIPRKPGSPTSTPSPSPPSIASIWPATAPMA